MDPPPMKNKKRCSTLRSMLWKNYLLKKANLIFTLTEFILPIFICVLFNLINTFLVYTLDFQSQLFLFSIIFDFYIPILCGNCSRFIIFHFVKEKESGVFHALTVMNLNTLQYGLSFILI